MLRETINGATIDEPPRRWRLNRAGIVNVYQYENDVLHFGGGRLLLRGVNGSGKSTAMNMLLPFLLTARQTRIDAAGEQSRVLKSWMLDGRDDSQPVGYLWVEFQLQDEFLVCGCGIRANRHSDTVRTWWFVTDKRPGIDIDLVNDGVPLSRETLRAALDGDEVFTHRRRAEYRRRVEQRLFGGSSIDEHIKLINVVRHPRVGDRIEVDLDEHLVNALPQLSEQALAEAAQPLEDLEEHRRSVEALKQTRDAVSGLLRVYSSYCENDLRQRIKSAQGRLAAFRASEGEERRQRQSAQSAQAELRRLDRGLDELDARIERLRREIAALEESRAYRDGQQLEPLRQLVEDLAKQAADAKRRIEVAKHRTSSAYEDVERAQRRGRSDLKNLNAKLASARELGAHCRTTSRPPGPAAVDEVPIDGVDAALPGELDEAGIRSKLLSALSSVTRRRDDVSKVEEALQRLDESERSLRRAELALEHRTKAAQAATDELASYQRHLAEVKRDWLDSTRDWAATVHEHLQVAELDGPRAAGLASGAVEEATELSHAKLRGDLLEEVQGLADHRQHAVSEVKARLSRNLEAEALAQARVDELAEMAEPEPPRLEWQSSAEHCLADLVDFAPSLTETDRAGLEGALQASGLLGARLTGASVVELASGELIAVPGERVQRPLSECLVVDIPDRLADVIDDEAVASLLRSISTDVSSSARHAVDVSGKFRLGLLRGRHIKEQAEFVGMTARRAALVRARAEAAEQLKKAGDVVTRRRTELSECLQLQANAYTLRAELPPIELIQHARADVRAATKAHSREETERKKAEVAAGEAERRVREADDALYGVASTLVLPRDAQGLDAVSKDLIELFSLLDQCKANLQALHRSLAQWRNAVERWRCAREEHGQERSVLIDVLARHEAEVARLRIIEERIGEEFAKIVADRDNLKKDAQEADVRLRALRKDRDAAFKAHARAEAEARTATEKREQVSEACEVARGTLQAVVDAPGYLDAIRGSDELSGAEKANNGLIVTGSKGANGLRELLAIIGELLPSEDSPSVGGAVSADGVRQSLFRRRDAMGAGYDAEALQPDPELPLTVELTGPFGRATLASAMRTVTLQHRQNAGLLDRKQADALRELLQGMVAREMATKVTGAARLIELMNQRLGGVTTAHLVGVSLRWRRRRDLDQATARMVDLLASVPDLRSEEDERVLRRMLSQRLDEARAEEPDAPYRQVIAQTLDYKQWHELAIMLNRDGKQAKLSRRTPLSEGEKKLVTYLPLFAAVAASSDALCEQQRAMCGGERSDSARFILLDDAFAKVSEDNHDRLFGLLVELDLDLIATSERLWGTHRSVPALSITEVVRDATLGAILLEHYNWNGRTLERRGEMS